MITRMKTSIKEKLKNSDDQTNKTILKLIYLRIIISKFKDDKVNYFIPKNVMMSVINP